MIKFQGKRNRTWVNKFKKKWDTNKKSVNTQVKAKY